MEKTKEELLNDYKKSNKKRREQIAKKAGFATGEDYLISLASTPVVAKKTKKAKPVENKMKGIFYVVDILDATGSMDGGKYGNSMKGIKDSIKDLQPRTDVVYSLIEFIDTGHELNHVVVKRAPSAIDVDKLRFNGAHGSNTPLYMTVYNVLQDIKVSKDDKVLVNVYTDGGNNTKGEFTPKCAELIKKLQKENFTITFAATAQDLVMIKRDINVEDSNTLAIANTAEGFRGGMQANRSSKMAYFASAVAGEDVLTGFYKKAGKL